MATDAAAVNGAIAAASAEERYFIASQRQLMWRRFRKHRMAVIAGVVLLLSYLVAFTYEFCAPYGSLTQHAGFVNAPPSRIRVIDADGRLRAAVRLRPDRPGEPGDLSARVRGRPIGDPSGALPGAR